MECRKLQVVLVSAQNLPEIRNFGRMKVYAEVSLRGRPKTAMKTAVDRDGETNPTWNFRTEYTLPESAVQEAGTNLGVKLFCERTVGDKLIGEVNVPVKSLFDMAQNAASYSVEGTADGVLNISYSFGEKISVAKGEKGAWLQVLGAGVSAVVEGAVGAIIS